MSKLVDGVPDFLCKPAAMDLQLFPVIQEEAYRLFLEMYKVVPDKKRIFYYFQKPEFQTTVAMHCPTLLSELRRLNLYNFFLRLLFVQDYYNPEKPMPAHRDYPYNFAYDNLGLNIPVRNYDHSYTVFYEGQDAAENNWHENYEHALGTPNIEVAVLGQQDSIREIARFKIDRPVWINSYALHAARHDPETDLENPRLILSLRFSSMKHLFDNGYFDEHLVANEE